MTVLTVQQSTELGTSLLFLDAGASGDLFLNDGQSCFFIANANASTARTATITFPTLGGAFSGLALSALSITLTAAKTTIIGRFPRHLFNGNSGHITITYDDPTDLTIAAVRNDPSKYTTYIPAPSLALPWTGATGALDGNGRPFITPALGSELLTDPGLEAWTSATNLTNYTEIVAGTSTVNQETVTIHGGSNAARLDVDVSADNVSINQAVAAATVGSWMQLSAWMRSSIVSGKSAVMIPSNSTPSVGATQNLTDVYTQFFQTGRVTSATPTISIARVAGSGGHSIYVDDLSYKIETLAAMMVSVSGAGNSLDVVVWPHTFVNGTQMGVVANLDNAGSPANLVLAYLIGNTTARIDKCVAGTWTTVVSASVTFVADAPLRIRRVPGTNTYQLWYNGAQVGTNQTIADAGIISNTRYGLFSTYSGNLFVPLFSLGGYSIPIALPGV